MLLIKFNYGDFVAQLTRTINLKGHIIDSLTLSKVFDEIQKMGGDYISDEIIVGKTKKDISHAKIKIMAPNLELMELILKKLHFLGAEADIIEEVEYLPAKINGVFPEGFYATSNLKTEIFYNNKWIEVDDCCMDSGICLDKKNHSAKCVKMNDVKKEDLFLIGFKGINIKKAVKTTKIQSFAFMKSGVSSEKPKSILIKKLASEIKEIRENKSGKILFVAGPALVHTGAVEHVCQIINKGYLDYLFAGNALAVHDIEAALFNTSLGVSIIDGLNTSHGHMNHLYAINKIRSIGSIKKAVDQGVLNKGIMYSCVKNNCDFLLAGSIRDDGPLPDVITNVLEAQKLMRKKIKDVKIAIMLSSMLHSIAVGNLLPAEVKTVCVDISPEVVTKLTDRGSHQTVGLVMDVEAFLQKLNAYL